MLVFNTRSYAIHVGGRVGLCKHCPQKVSGVVLTNPGSGYTTEPTITIKSISATTGETASGTGAEMLGVIGISSTGKQKIEEAGGVDKIIEIFKKRNPKLEVEMLGDAVAPAAPAAPAAEVKPVETEIKSV